MNESITAPAPTALGGLRVVRARRLEDLGDELSRRWAPAPGDAFATDLVVVETAGMQRWISQRLAGGWGSAGEGVCAGVKFVTPEWLERQSGEAAADPWQPSRSVWGLRTVLSRTLQDPRLAVLQRHLAASRETWTPLHRIADRFAQYARWRPTMVAAWAAGGDVDALGRPLGEHAWQAHLWRLLADELGSPDPVAEGQARHHHLADALTPLPAGRMAVFAPSRWTPGQRDLIRALATRRPVEVLLLTPSPTRWPASPAVPGPRVDPATEPSGHPLNSLLGRHADEAAGLARGLAATSDLIGEVPALPETLLGRLQDDLIRDAAPPPRRLAPQDDSVRIHRSHGLDRQVEVLRDVLADLLDRHPGLEPRDIVVVTPDVDAVAPLVTAAFGLGAERPEAHPAHRFRVQIADRTAAQANPLVGLLLQVLHFGESRLEASTLLRFCAEPPVARRFGFTPDSADRMTDLVTRAGVRWGLTAAQRRPFGVGSLNQNTWTAGLQRLLLGVALSEDDLVTAKTTLPMDDVDSSDVDLLGGLAELVGRLGRLLGEFATPATMPAWLDRCRRVVDELVGLPDDQQWQRADLWAGLSRIAERQPPDGPAWNLTEVIRTIEDEFAGHPARASFGNGSLVVCGLSALARVPHRVVCLLGWDVSRYPRSAVRHGDDLLAQDPWVGDPSPGLRDRQALLDAVHAAREHLVIIYRARSEATNEPIPAPTPLAELVDALNRTAVTEDGLGAGEAVSLDHRLQPFDPAYYDGRLPGSFDPVGLAGARAAVGVRAAAVNRFTLTELPPPAELDPIPLENLLTFFSHPVRTLLKERTGLSLAETARIRDEIPIELDGLQRWAIGSRALPRAIGGAGPDEVLQAEWLRGDVPPGELGRRVLNGVFRDIDTVMRQLPPERSEPAHVRDLSVDLAGTTVSGRVTTRRTTILTAEFGGLQSRYRLASWLRLLLLAAAEPGEWRAVTVTRRGVGEWRAPAPEAARGLLAELVGIYRLGLCRPLPMPPRVCEGFAHLRASRRDPDDHRNRKSLEQPWSLDNDRNWEVFFTWPGMLDIAAVPGVGHPEERTLLGGLARTVWDPLLAHQVA